MATVTRSSIGNLHDKVTVSISKDDYYGAFDKALKNASKNVNIPGFRKGNVPAGMIKKMYGKSILLDEILRTANKELEDYLQAEKPSIFAQPLALPIDGFDAELDNLKDYTFEFEIGLKPTFELPIIKQKGAVTKYNIKIEDSLIDAEVENIQKRAGSIEEITALEDANDIAYIDYTTEGLDKVEDVVSFDKLPKIIEEAFKGKSAGEIVNFQPAKDLSEAELTDFSKTVVKRAVDTFNEETTYTATLTKVGRVQARALDASLFEDVFPNQNVTTEADFREKLAAEVAKEGNRITNERLQNDIFETLIHETKIELPTEFLKNWIKRGGEKIKTDEEVAAEYPGFEHQLIWTIISDKLIQEYGIKVEYDEVIAEMKSRVLAYFGVQEGDDEPEWLAGYMDKMVKDQNTLDETYRRLLFDRLFTKIAENMELAEEEVTGEEFSKIPNKYHHQH